MAVTSQITRPLVSILTPCLNRARLVAEAIESVRNQDYPYIEHIIVDGGSVDGTLDILHGYPHLHVISETDESIYEALNKGFLLAQGEIIGHLNTDDLYESDVISNVVDMFVIKPELDAVVGSAIIFEIQPDGEKKVFRKYPAVSKGDLIRRTATSAPIFNAWFFRRRVFQKVGIFNPHYRIAGDSDFMMRVALAGINYDVVDKEIYQYRMHSDSRTISNDPYSWSRAEKEVMEISKTFLEAGISGEAEGYCKLWYKRASEYYLNFELNRRNFPEAWKAVWQGWMYNKHLPLIFFRRVFRNFAVLPYQAIKRLFDF